MSKIKEFILIISVFLIVLLLIFGLVFFKNQITGKVSLELDSNYQEGEALDGIVKLALKEGELIPTSSRIVFENSEEIYEYELSSVISESPIEGNFYIEGLDISGSGEGYGIEGNKIRPEVVYFKLNIYSKSSSEGGSEESISEIDANSNELPEQSQSQGQNNELPEQSQSQGQNNELPEQAQGQGQNNELPEQAQQNKEKNKNNKITGKVSLEVSEEINGDVSVDNEFVYNLPPGKSVEIISGSVRTKSGEELPDNTISLNTKGNKATITTDYSEKGFGKEYGGNDVKVLEIDLSKINFIPKEGDLRISLIYEDKNILSLTTPLTQGRLFVRNEFDPDPKYLRCANLAAGSDPNAKHGQKG